MLWCQISLYGKYIDLLDKPCHFKCTWQLLLVEKWHHVWCSTGSKPRSTWFKFKWTGNIPALSVLNHRGRYSSHLKWSKLDGSHICSVISVNVLMALNFLNKSVTSVIITHSKEESITHSESCKGLGLTFDRQGRECYYSNYWLKYCISLYYFILHICGQVILNNEVLY